MSEPRWALDVWLDTQRVLGRLQPAPADIRKDVCRCGHKREHHDEDDGDCRVLACRCAAFVPIAEH